MISRATAHALRRVGMGESERQVKSQRSKVKSVFRVAKCAPIRTAVGTNRCGGALRPRRRHALSRKRLSTRGSERAVVLQLRSGQIFGQPIHRTGRVAGQVVTRECAGCDRRDALGQCWLDGEPEPAETGLSVTPVFIEGHSLMMVGCPAGLRFFVSPWLCPARPSKRL
jgi:hypothetical protein